MADKTLRQIAGDGLWHNNVAFVQILGLCPLLAVTSSVVNGLGLGLATLLTLVLSNVTVSAIRNLIRPDIRIPVFVMLIASIVTAIELAMHAWFHELHGILGIFIPLIVTNCSILGRAEAFASKNNIGRSFVDGLTMGLGFAAALVLLGAMRELLGAGTLFDQAHLMFGEAARSFRLTVFEDYKGFLLAILPPGAFIGLGLLIALKNVIDQRRAAAPQPATSAAEAPAAP
ncbi:electron transport complex subunit E [Sulfurivermis fontis]|uniref:electron transport complex subunit E n=1 Tax=Sulfurivermis fontis TaxID=1972068 RepID=UPI000FDB5EDA|nr:electron transport complex subunit E [Sulfurivermis fontis]